MNIGFRVDSSSKIGTGHLHRCITLAKLFKKKGIRSFFFSRNEAGNVNSKIKKYGFELKKISSNKRDLANELDIIKNYIISLNINFVFIDNYSIKPSWEKKISQYSKIVLIDDFLTRKTYCDYYINYHLVEGIENKKFFVKKKLCQIFRAKVFDYKRVENEKKK